jgi:hypothetical protein
MRFLGGLFLGSLAVVCMRTGWKLHTFEGGVRFACGTGLLVSFVTVHEVPPADDALLAASIKRRTVAAVRGSG